MQPRQKFMITLLQAFQQVKVDKITLNTLTNKKLRTREHLMLPRIKLLLTLL